MVDASGIRHQAAALVVSPMALHRILAARELVTYFVEPHCLFADRLRRRYGVGVAAAPELGELTEQDVADACRRPSRDLDARLVTALAMLADSTVSMPRLAVSRTRLTESKEIVWALLSTPRNIVRRPDAALSPKA